MKKVSTVAAKASKKISQLKLPVGLDLGDRNSWFCVLDESGQIQLEQRVRTTAKALQEIFGAMPRSRIALEIGTHSPWISRLLQELGHEVIVANARKVRLITTVTGLLPRMPWKFGDGTSPRVKNRRPSCGRRFASAFLDCLRP